MTTETARLVIPVWGEAYVERLLSITLPAVLAPGNLPALQRIFDVDLVIVTEARLFETIRSSRSFQSAELIVKTKLIPLDDLLTDVFGDYGMVLTYALFRGFADLGARMSNTFLLFLNADFLISDGSLRHVGNLMQRGKHVIHAPSFRVIAEDMEPELQLLVDAKSCTLSVPSRRLAKLALAHKHATVKARTINQKLCHLRWMDQFYWYVDDESLIGYQSPAALVAVKPERFVSQPVTFWDYGFLPEAAPSSEPHFIGDSDDFFMVELQSRNTGQEMIEIGWTSLDDLARNESLRATKEHRISSEQLIKIHAADLPPDIDIVIDDSRAFMAELYRRLSPKPAPYMDHPLLGQWFNEATLRQRGPSHDADSQPASQQLPRSTTRLGATNGQALLASATKVLQNVYCRLFGVPPKVNKCHPLWADVSPISRKIALWQRAGAVNILHIDSGNGRMLINNSKSADRVVGAHHLYDACVCELALKELSELDRLYLALRPLIKNGGHVLFNVVKTENVFDGGELFLITCDFPDIDVSEINFHGAAATAWLRALYTPAMRQASSRPLARGLLICALIGLAPVVWLANVWAARRDPTIFLPTWTSLTVEFTVKRRQTAVPAT